MVRGRFRNLARHGGPSQGKLCFVQRHVAIQDRLASGCSQGQRLILVQEGKRLVEGVFRAQQLRQLRADQPQAVDHSTAFEAVPADLASFSLEDLGVRGAPQ